MTAPPIGWCSARLVRSAESGRSALQSPGHLDSPGDSATATIFSWLPATLCLAFLLMAALPNWIGVVLFFLHQIPFGIHWSLIQEFVNQRVQTVSRATALSVVSFVGRVSFAMWIPVIGELRDTSTVRRPPTGSSAWSESVSRRFGVPRAWVSDCSMGTPALTPAQAQAQAPTPTPTPTPADARCWEPMPALHPPRARRNLLRGCEKRV